MAIGFFQKRIEEIINAVVESDETSQITVEQIEQLSSQLALYFSTILLTLAGILLLVIVLFWMFKRRDNPRSNLDKPIERQRILQELENQFLTINSQPSLWLINRSTYDAKVVYEFSLALTSEVPWYAPQNIQTSWHMGDRMASITDQNDLLTASVLDEILFWFRRLDRAVSSDLIKVEDIYSLWRQILPFAIDNRFSFMAAYFANDQSGDLEDIEAIRKVLIGVIRYCQQQKISPPLAYINGRLDSLFFDELPKGMKNGLERSRSTQGSRQEPIVIDEPAAIMPRDNKTDRKEPVIKPPEQMDEKPKNTTRKEPTVSFEDDAAPPQKPDKT